MLQIREQVSELCSSAQLIENEWDEVRKDIASNLLGMMQKTALFGMAQKDYQALWS